MRKYQHYKGGLYELICYAKMESSGEEMAVYFSLATRIRPAKEFEEKFKLVKDNA